MGKREGCSPSPRSDRRRASARPCTAQGAPRSPREGIQICIYIHENNTNNSSTDMIKVQGRHGQAELAAVRELAGGVGGII